MLERYGGESTDELLALEGQCRTDALVLLFEEALIQKAARSGLDALTLEERSILAIEALEREVNNGGYRQLFTNVATQLVSGIVDALERAGCSQAARITRRAVSVAGEAVPGTDLSNLERWRIDALQGCDDEYFALAGDLSNALLQFIKRERARIVLG